ncbi:MAG TPA: NAD(P)-binding protein [Pirellulales bacterium]|nr:NAD(P)-binding protein [Pirellulales bacterium]
MDYDTIIIGAGVSGLAAGIRLAYYDRRVCILERHTTIGGLNSFYRLDGRNHDVGLHAVTNFTPKGTKKGPLASLLRQLRIGWDEFALVPQIGSRIAFPGVTLDFTNDFELLRSQIHGKFPSQKDNFERLVGQIADYDDLDLVHSDRSAREAVSAVITDPLLVEMLFCPLMFYGSARERDMDYAQFCVMFRSIFCEGLARPPAGVRPILKLLVRKFKALGGQLRLRSGVNRIAVASAAAAKVVLDDGSELTANNVLSSAGWLETMRMCDDVSRIDECRPGRLSFTESISVLDCQPRELGYDRTVLFYNDSEQFHWEQPDALVDPRSGVICSPNNFAYGEPLEEGRVRITSLANFGLWNSLAEPDYRLAKLRWYDATVASAVRFMPDFRANVIATDMFTPTTIRRFTGHDGGAVYGAPDKHYDGTTHLKNLFVCGTDQGFLGIIGAITSGISIANRHLLKDEGGRRKDEGGSTSFNPAASATARAEP